MDIRKAINQLLLEDHKHDFGCAMLYFDFPQIKDIHNQIDENDLYIDEEDPSFGLESEPHCTLLYGLHDVVTTDEVKTLLKNDHLKQPFVGYNMSLFDTNPKYDVLKLDVYTKSKSSTILRRVNKLLSSLPPEESPHKYHPHMTIAYLKKGTGQKYIDAYQGTQFDLNPSYAVYSKPDGTEDKIEI